MILILDNIRSAHNVGSLFRTADAVKVKEVILLGTSPLPFDRFGREDKTITKTALGAEKTVLWKYMTADNCIDELKKQGYTILVLEQSLYARDCFDFVPQKDRQYALVVGNEVDGVSQEFLSGDFQILEIPMKGQKESLNVSVAGGIALYHLARHLFD